MKIYLYVDVRVQHALDLATLVEELETAGYTVLPMQGQGRSVGLAAGAAFSADDVIVILQPLRSEQLRVPAILERRIIKIGVPTSPAVYPGQASETIQSHQIATAILAQFEAPSPAPPEAPVVKEDMPKPSKPITAPSSSTVPPVITTPQPPAEKDFVQIMQETMQRWIESLATQDFVPRNQPALPDTDIRGGASTPVGGEVRNESAEEDGDDDQNISKSSTPPDFSQMTPEELTNWIRREEVGDIKHEIEYEVIEALKERPPTTSPIEPSKQDSGVIGRFFVSENQDTNAQLKDTIQFSAYFPHITQPEQRYGLFVYAHTAPMLAKTQQDVTRFEDELGGSVPPPKTGKQEVQIEQGTLLRVVPECDEIEFDPPYLEKKWRGDWTRYEFGFTPPPKLVGESLWVRVSVQIAGIEIAHIKCDIEVAGTLATRPASARDPKIDKSGVPVGDALPDNPLAVAKLKSSTARMYQKIFISYSRKDGEVARAYRLAQMAAGHEVFLDTENIRTGEDWQAALAKAIDEADIFQLFWSEHSAASANVRDEWDYCLTYKCVEDECRGFIRPVYWKKPMPAPPPQLDHLNFRYVPLQPEEES